MSKKYRMLHPTISFRCRSIEEYKKIKEMVKRCGKSESDYVREIILGAEEKESQSFEAGRKQEMNKFYLPCPDCKEAMCVDLNIDKESRRKIFEIFGTYKHTKCINKNKQKSNDIIFLQQNGNGYKIIKQ